MKLRASLSYLLVLLLIALIAGCASGGPTDSTEAAGGDSASEVDGVDIPDAGDVEAPDDASAETYGAIEKFNEFSVSFMATMVKNLEDAMGDLGLSQSKAFYGSIRDIRCGCEVYRDSGTVACRCVDADDGHCYGRAARSLDDKSVVLAALVCEDFNLDEDTSFAGSLEGKISISPLVIDLLGDRYGAFFGEKEIGSEGELDDCRIDDTITRVCNLSNQVCLRSSSLVAIALEVGGDGFVLYDKCGDVEFGPESRMAASFCFKSFTSFLTTFVFKGELNGEPSYMKNNIICNVKSLLSF